MMRGLPVRPRWVLVVAFAVMFGRYAQGFYFSGWPANPPTPPSLVPAGASTAERPPGLSLDPPHQTATTPQGSNPQSTPNPPAPPLPGHGSEPTAPEPGTAALAAVGLGLVGLLQWRRRISAPR
jgi:MYXO-CTERM domain-containing protein